MPLAVVVGLSAVGGWLMAKRALSGVDDVTRTAINIEGRPRQTCPDKRNRDEIDRLAKTFNHMVDRVQALIGQMKEITENIALIFKARSPG